VVAAVVDGGTGCGGKGTDMSKQSRVKAEQLASVDEDAAPEGSAFGDTGDQAAEPTAEAASDQAAEPTAEAASGEAAERRRAEGHEAPRPEPLRVLTRREQVLDRIAEIEREGGPIARTQRVNMHANDCAARIERDLAEARVEMAALRARVRALEQQQQCELEELRLLKIEQTTMHG